MKAVIAVLALVATAYGGVIAPTTLIRTPSLDSAVIQSDRLGGNFAYSSVEGHAYAAVSPVVQNAISPIGVSYSASPIISPLGYPLVNNVVLAHGAPFGGPLLIAPGAAPTLVAPFAPGVVAPGVIPIVEPVKEGEPAETPAAAVEPASVESAEIQPEAPVVVEAPAEPQESSQSDDIVTVDSA